MKKFQNPPDLAARKPWKGVAESHIRPAVTAGIKPRYYINNMKKGMNRILAVVIFALTAVFSGVATASEKFDDNAVVEIKDMPGGGGIVWILEKTGEDKKQDAGIYRLRHKSTGHYLEATKADAGTMVGFTTKDTDAKKGSEWILIKNSSGWSIIAKANGAITVTRNSKSSSGIELQKNQGSKDQVWQITPVK